MSDLDDQLARLEARWTADDPTFARRLSNPGAAPPGRATLVGVCIACTALVVGGIATADVALGLMALPVAATAAVLAYGRLLATAWHSTGAQSPDVEPHDGA